MIYRVSDLYVDIPSGGGLAERCKAYLDPSGASPDITIREARYRPEVWPRLTYDNMAYMESGVQFYLQLLRFNGMMLHSSAVAMDGRAYLFSGPCGAGKSTHTRLWQSEFGENAVVFNDDKPALRLINGEWIAYGTPWCGKDGININMKAPVAGICFLQRGELSIRRLGAEEALGSFLSQTMHRIWERQMDRLLTLVDDLIARIPIFELTSHAEPECAHLSYETLLEAAQNLL